MPKATVIGKADEGNLQVRLDEGSGDRKTTEGPKRSARVPASTDSGSVQKVSAPLLLYEVLGPWPLETWHSEKETWKWVLDPLVKFRGG